MEISECRGPDITAEDSTAELYLPTTLRRSFSQNADSTAELEQCGIPLLSGAILQGRENSEIGLW